MKVTLAMVMSLDGKTTQGELAGTTWASAEDQSEFKALLKRHDRIVMGSATYVAVRSQLKLDPNKLRVILTRTPEEFLDHQQPGLLFSAASAQQIVADAKQAGCKNLLVVGGAQTNARFLQAGLIDELYVTIEPVLFGNGLSFTTSLPQPVHLQLLDTKQLNADGTLLLHYKMKDETYENSKI